jgi:S-adenosylhomocysteine hydrolase
MQKRCIEGYGWCRHGVAMLAFGIEANVIVTEMNHQAKY